MGAWVASHATTESRAPSLSNNMYGAPNGAATVHCRSFIYSEVGKILSIVRSMFQRGGFYERKKSSEKGNLRTKGEERKRIARDSQVSGWPRQVDHLCGARASWKNKNEKKEERNEEDWTLPPTPLVTHPRRGRRAGVAAGVAAGRCGRGCSYWQCTCCREGTC